MTPDINRVTDLELKILQIIWQENRCAVSDIIEKWQDSQKPGYTTILKTLQKMEKKGIVDHTKDGKRYLYFSKLTREQVSKNRLGTIIDRIFKGNTISFAQFFIDNSELDLEDLAEIRRIVAKKEKMKKEQS